MAWRIKFIPDEVSSVGITIDGEHALDWQSAEGEVFKPVPAKWANNSKIHVRADGAPNGKNAHVQVWWDGDEKCNMEFDNGEDCTAEK